MRQNGQNGLMTKTPTLLILGLALLSPAFAEDESGNAMYPSCKGLVDGKWTTRREAQCAGVITATLAMAKLGEIATSCPPTGVTHKQAQRVVVHYLDQHPERLHLPLSELASEALSKAWPCS